MKIHVDYVKRTVYKTQTTRKALPCVSDFMCHVSYVICHAPLVSSSPLAYRVPKLNYMEICLHIPIHLRGIVITYRNSFTYIAFYIVLKPM
jgi:hypothetical protein